MQQKYYSADIKGLQIKSVKPLKYNFILLKKEVPHFRNAFGRWLTVDTKSATNTLNEAADWLANYAETNKQMKLEELQKSIIPYMDKTTLKPLSAEKEQELQKIYSKKRK